MKPEKLTFIRLGARYKLVEKLGIAEPFQLLNHAQKSRLPVPNGILLLEQGWDYLIREGVVSFDENGEDDVSVEGVEPFLEPLALHLLSKKKGVMEIRPQFPTDMPLTSIETFKTTDSAELVRHLVTLWRTETGEQKDVLVLNAAEAITYGTATTLVGDSADTVYVNGETYTLPHFQSFKKSSKVGWERRLQRLLDGVRRSMNLRGDSWQIEWADDDKTCWLLSIDKISGD